MTAVLWLVPVLAAPIDVMPGDDLKSVLDGLGPGDVVTIHGGTYGPMGFTDFQWFGTAQDPIVIQGAEGDQVVILGDGSQNTLNIRGSYFTLRNLEIDGGSHGIRMGSCDHVLLEDLVVHGVDDVGLSCNRSGEVCDNVTIRGVEIYDTGLAGGPGECMYLGCNDDACRFQNSVVEWNYCHHTTAGGQGDGIEVKTGSYGNVVRHNVIHDVKFPGIILYGTGGDDAPNRVEGNVIFRVQENGIQTVGDALVVNNIVFEVGGYGIHAKPSQGEQVENLTIAHNTVYLPGGTCLKGNDWALGAGNIEVRSNAFLCEGGNGIHVVGGDGGAFFTANGILGAVVGVVAGTFDLGTAEAAVGDAPNGDFYPVERGPLVDAGAFDVDPAEDFDCRMREDGSPDVGAYEWAPPGSATWPIQEGFKTCIGSGGGTTGGGTGGSAGDGGGTGTGSGGGGATTTTTGATGGGGTSQGGTTGVGGSGAATAGGGAGTAGAGSSGGGGCGCGPRGGDGTPWAWLMLLPVLSCRRRVGRVWERGPGPF